MPAILRWLHTVVLGLPMPAVSLEMGIGTVIIPRSQAFFSIRNAVF